MIWGSGLAVHGVDGQKRKSQLGRPFIWTFADALAGTDQTRSTRSNDKHTSRPDQTRPDPTGLSCSGAGGPVVIVVDSAWIESRLARIRGGINTGLLHKPQSVWGSEGDLVINTPKGHDRMEPAPRGYWRWGKGKR